VAFTLVHCADIHLETTFPDTRGGATRRAALSAAFVRIVDEALERRADALTIGGDLYEAERAGPATVRFLFEQFARFGKPIFLAPGNHDPHAPGSLLARADVPENVLIFNEAAWRAIPLAEGITLFGFGHTPAEPGRPFANARFERGGVQIALVHGSDEARCPPGKRATAPFTQREVSAAGASLLLTGHYHGGYLATERGRAAIAYPGSPEPIRFGEGPAHGIVVLRVEGDNVEASLVPIARTRLYEFDCDLSGIGHEHAAIARIEKQLAQLGRQDYVRMRLTGQIAHGTRLDVSSLQERFAPALGSLELSDRTSSFDYELISREPTVRGHVVRDLLNQVREERSEVAEDALRYALAAFDGAEIAP
jgi:DNA repair exonuclease SbcCD nuclease subunit